MSIISVDTFQEYIDASGLSEDDLQIVVDGVNAALLRAMHRPALRVSGEQYTSNGLLSSHLYVNWPIVSITSIHEDYAGYFGQPTGSFPDSSELVLGEDWVRDPNDPKSPLIRMDGCPWCTVPGSIKIDYVWGWSSAPNDLIAGALRLCALAWDQRFREGGVQSETFGKYSYQLLMGGSTGDNDHDSDLLAIRRTVAAHALEVV